jgi:homocysteine S-methyltransferase
VAKYRDALPQLGGDFFMTDGGLETTLIFLEGQDLPHFAAFLLLETPEGEGVPSEILPDIRGARQEV